MTMPESCVGGVLSLPAATGVVDIESSAIVGRVLATLLGIPRSGGSNVTIRITPSPRGDRWQRSFARRGFTTTVRIVDGQLHEFLGPTGLEFDLDVADDGAAMALAGMRIGPWRLPVPLAIRLDVVTERTGDRLFVDVRLSRGGRRGSRVTLLRYHGTIA